MQLGVKYATINTDSSLTFYKQSIRMSQENKLYSLHGKALINMAFDYYFANDSLRAIDYIDSAITVLKIANDSNRLVTTYYNKGVFKANYGHDRESLEYYLQGLRFAAGGTNLQHEAYCQNNLGKIYHSFGNYEKSIEHILKSIEIKEQMKGLESEPLKATLIESRSRVASMELIHQMLYESESQSSVNLKNTYHN